MNKISSFILLIGLIAGFFVGGMASYAEWDLNPQGEYDGDLAGLMLVFYLWASTTSYFFTLMAFVITSFRRFRKKERQKKSVSVLILYSGIAFSSIAIMMAHFFELNEAWLINHPEDRLLFLYSLAGAVSMPFSMVSVCFMFLKPKVEAVFKRKS